MIVIFRAAAKKIFEKIEQFTQTFMTVYKTQQTTSETKYVKDKFSKEDWKLILAPQTLYCT